MKTVCAFVLLALAASAGTASATTVAKIETSVSNIDVEVQGTVTFGQAESKAQLTINVGSTSTGKVTIENIITIKTPSCKSGEATLSTDGSIALTAPSQFTTAYTTAKTAVSALPDLDEGVKIKYSKSMGTGQAIECMYIYATFVTHTFSHPPCRRTRTCD